MLANEFYSARARTSMLEGATMHVDFYPVEYLQKPDHSAIKAEHQQVSFDKYVEHHAADGSEFEFKNTSKGIRSNSGDMRTLPTK